MSVVWLPKCSDIYGRNKFIMLTFIVQTGCQIGLYYTRSLNVAFGIMVLFGMTHPGKNVVLFNYVLEVTPKKYEESLVSLFLFFDFSAIIGICASYQYVTIDWRPLQILGLAWIISSLIYAYFYFCESPKFLYIN